MGFGVGVGVSPVLVNYRAVHKPVLEGMRGLFQFSPYTKSEGNSGRNHELFKIVERNSAV